jgi:hypothetical protein
VERRGWVIRAGTIMGQLETGGARRFRWGAAALRDGTSRVMGDCQARICEGLGVKFPGPTRRDRAVHVMIATKFGWEAHPADGGKWTRLNSRPEHIKKIAEASVQAAQGECDRSVLPASCRGKWPRDICRRRAWRVRESCRGALFEAPGNDRVRTIPKGIT